MMTALELPALDREADRYRPSRSAAPAIGAVVVQVLIGYLLITGLAVGFSGHVPEMLQTFTASPPSPPPPPVEQVIPPKPKSHKPDGAASPANLKAKPTDLVAPTLPPPIPQTIAAAPKAGPGTAPSAGASNVPGPGTGAGGQGTGSGSGDQGSGDGDDDGDGEPPRLRHMGIKSKDYPPTMSDNPAPRPLLTRLSIDAQGRVTHCAVTQSSGDAEYDAVTCRLVEQRSRFAPARDAHGKPVPSYAVGEHEWTGRRPRPPDERQN